MATFTMIRYWRRFRRWLSCRHLDLMDLHGWFMCRVLNTHKHMWCRGRRDHAYDHGRGKMVRLPHHLVPPPQPRPEPVLPWDDPQHDMMADMRAFMKPEYLPDFYLAITTPADPTADTFWKREREGYWNTDEGQQILYGEHYTERTDGDPATDRVLPREEALKRLGRIKPQDTPMFRLPKFEVRKEDLTTCQPDLRAVLAAELEQAEKERIRRWWERAAGPITDQGAEGSSVGHAFAHSINREDELAREDSRLFNLLNSAIAPWDGPPITIARTTPMTHEELREAFRKACEYPHQPMPMLMPHVEVEIGPVNEREWAEAHVRENPTHVVLLAAHAQCFWPTECRATVWTDPMYSNYQRRMWKGWRATESVTAVWKPKGDDPSPE